MNESPEDYLSPEQELLCSLVEVAVQDILNYRANPSWATSFGSQIKQAKRSRREVHEQAVRDRDDAYRWMFVNTDDISPCSYNWTMRMLGLSPQKYRTKLITAHPGLFARLKLSHRLSHHETPETSHETPDLFDTS